MHTKIFSATTVGVETYLVEVEVDLSFGLLQFFIVGLADTAIKESRQRVQTALKNCSIKLPERKITVNLAPADLKKEGTTFDLAIAVGILNAGNLIAIDNQFIQETIFLGELSLDGTIKPIKGVLPISYDAPSLGKKRVIVPFDNANEAALTNKIEVIGVKNLLELIAYLRKELAIEPSKANYKDYLNNVIACDLNFNEVKGQFAAKRALQIAAAGRHNILFIGSPGSGKTMLAKRLSSIMPAMSFDEILQTSKIYSASGKLDKKPLVIDRPFRSPHHTISQAGLVGGGTYPQPGEISLAHNGILFLDELTEFKREVLEALRQPLEHRTVCIARAHQTVSFPASFLLVAALNPCPCGFFGDKNRNCTCTKLQISKYIAKLSGPLLDRIDLQINVPSVDYDTITNKDTQNLSSEILYEQIKHAVNIQNQRKCWNAYLLPSMTEQHCKLNDSSNDLIKKAFDKLHLTMRGYHKLLKIARTIADLESSQEILTNHIKEALLYRSLDQSVTKRELTVNIGIDAVEIERFKNWINYSDRKLLRIFSQNEITYCKAMPAKAGERFAGRFAIKEAFFKAITHYLQDSTPLLTVLKNIEVIKEDQGNIRLKVNNELFKLEKLNLSMSCSLTHTKTTAIAVIVIFNTSNM